MYAISLHREKATVPRQFCCVFFEELNYSYAEGSIGHKFQNHEPLRQAFTRCSGSAKEAMTRPCAQDIPSSVGAGVPISRTAKTASAASSTPKRISCTAVADAACPA